MQKEIRFQIKPEEAENDAIVKEYIAQAEGVSYQKVTGFHIINKSIDARSKHQVWINLGVKAFINEPFVERVISKRLFQEVNHSNKSVIIIGAGPAGLFAALKLLEKGIKPIILERGKDVRSRRRDLAQLNKTGIVNPESNYCFGEGGAGTYSDGKLYTRSNKRGNIADVLNTFVQFGAEESILYESHPHIGTNKLPQIIVAMRETIQQRGGEVLFEHKVTDFIIKNQTIEGVKTANGNSFYGDSVILATGHSARDIFELLHNKNILIEPKPFALGVRVEHPQTIINRIQYHHFVSNNYLPPASYTTKHQVDDKGVFSFCMCPGGIIAPAATSPNELVVNGWSPSKRNNPFANSGIVVSVEAEDAIEYFKSTHSTSSFKTLDLNADNPLLFMYLQQAIEQKAYSEGRGDFVAPAQRMTDFCQNQVSSTLPTCSYIPGVVSSDLSSVLPPFIHYRLQEAFKAFGRKMQGYYTNEAIVVATESRTSSPVRIPRDSISFEHPQIKNLYPCAEGAGYAGGIVSAAMDGENIANLIALKFGY